MGNIYLETSEKLAEYAKQHDSIIVAYSGGKDSRAVLDLCCKTFPRVVCFHMYLVPGLACIEEAMQFARDRYKVEIIYYPHWVGYRCLRDGIFGFRHWKKSDLPDISVHDVELLVRLETGIDLVAHGSKKSEGVWRRRMLTNTAHRTERVYPILEWNRWHTLAYLRRNNIPIPEGDSAEGGGVDLSTPAVLWLYDKFPDDFAKVERVFPFVRAVVKRREFYGVV
jgi:3'-phosphoadenosine 5'-phosphosulfate sulfotransferase (PAPS reductase)/FAD synthetase